LKTYSVFFLDEKSVYVFNQYPFINWLLHFDLKIKNLNFKKILKFLIKKAETLVTPRGPKFGTLFFYELFDSMSKKKHVCVFYYLLRQQYVFFLQY
jgi:hypothetical protein